MKILTPSQIEDVLKIVDKYTLTFVAQSVGADILTDDDREVLESYGIDTSDIKPHDSNVTQAFKFGLLSDALGHAAASKLTYSQFKTSLKEGTFIPLNVQEKAMLTSLHYSTYSHVNKLGGNVKNDIRSGIIDIDRRGMVSAGSVVRDSVKEGIEKRKSVSAIASMIGKKTGDWNRDLLKIANYNLHESFNQGRLSNMERTATYGTRVFFDVYPGACVSCIRVYLTAGFGSEPKSFKISDIRANGTNIGKKSKDWLATIGPVHPNCRCTVNEIPEGYKWDPLTRSYLKPDKSKINKVERKSKVSVTVNKNGKTTTTEI